MKIEFVSSGGAAPGSGAVAALVFEGGALSVTAGRIDAATNGALTRIRREVRALPRHWQHAITRCGSS